MWNLWKLNSKIQLEPNVVIGNDVNFSDNVFIGANSTIIERIIIQENIFIGASSLVIDNNLKPNLRYAGVPAKIIWFLPPQVHILIHQPMFKV